MSTTFPPKDEDIFQVLNPQYQVHFSNIMAFPCQDPPPQDFSKVFECFLQWVVERLVSAYAIRILTDEEIETQA